MVGETTSKRIEIERSFFDIVNFFFLCLNDNAQFTKFDVQPSYFLFFLKFLLTYPLTKTTKKYHLFIHLSILINRIEQSAWSIA